MAAQRVATVSTESPLTERLFFQLRLDMAVSHLCFHDSSCQPVWCLIFLARPMLALDSAVAYETTVAYETKVTVSQFCK